MDAFRAYDEVEAGNYAYNVFAAHQSDSGAIMYGETIFIADTISSITPKVIAVLDLSDEYNATWNRSMDVFERMLLKESDGETQQDD